MTDDDIRAAMALEGWRWMRGMLSACGRAYVEPADCGEAAWLWVADDGCEWLPEEGMRIDPDDPATGGCLLSLLGDEVWRVEGIPSGTFLAWIDDHEEEESRRGESLQEEHPTLGRACIAVALSLGKWPGGVQ